MVPAGDSPLERLGESVLLGNPSLLGRGRVTPNGFTARRDLILVKTQCNGLDISQPLLKSR